MSFFRSPALKEVSNNQDPSEVQVLKVELEKLSARELSLKMADKKEGEYFVDKILKDESLFSLVLKKTAGTVVRKFSSILTQENHFRHCSALPFSEEIIKERNGGYLLEICKHSKKFEDFLLQNAKIFKERNIIDDQVIDDVKQASEAREAQEMSFHRYHD